jgi:UDP-3-O-[3-hydroxymyristoyl] glucosamine N-acyltransferase
MTLTLEALAEKLGCAYEGDGTTEILGVAALESAQKGDLVFLAKTKLAPLLEKTRASAAILPPAYPFVRLPVLRAENPQRAFAAAAELFHKPYRPAPGIHASAVVAPSAKLGAGVSVGPFAVIGEDVEIGPGAAVFAHVTIYPGVRIGASSIIHSGVQLREGVTIGSRVIIHNGAVIGADGFSYLRAEDGSHIKIPQMGTVIIEDDVEIGANSCVDRAALEATIIRRGVKIDDLVMVSHNCEVGENTVLVSQVGIAGSSRIGKGVILSGQAGIADHLTVGDGAIVAAKTGVTGHVPAGAFISGSPHLDIRVWRKFWAAAPHLYELLKDFKKMKARVDELEKKNFPR